MNVFLPVLFTANLLAVSVFSCFSQVTIAFQGFEGTSADNWGFTPPTQNTTLPIVQVGAANYGSGFAATGVNSMRAGGGSPACGTGGMNCFVGTSNGGTCTNNSNGDVVAFSALNVQCYSNMQLSVAYRTHPLCQSNSGEGLDSGDFLYFEVSLNGGAWTIVATVAGSNNCTWTYLTSTVQCGSNAAVANPFLYAVPAGTQTIAFRTRIQRNRTDEVYYIDDVKLTGTANGLSAVSIQHIDP